jgi:hypothetical protein
MKTKIQITLSVLIAFSFILAVSGCKKNESKPVSGDSSSIQQLTKDENQVQNGTDDVYNDVEFLMSGSAKGDLKSPGIWGGPCNVTIDSTTVQDDSVTVHIRYHGPNCSGHLKRYGLVEVKYPVGIHWYQPHATVLVYFINDTITRVINNKTMILNGRKTYENVDGGVIWELGNLITSVTHKISGYLTATFEDGSSRLWHVARLRVVTGTPPTPTDDGHLVISEDGFGEADGYSNLSVWGINRQGETFYTKVNQPVVVKQDCQFDPCSGIVFHEIPAAGKSATVTFGYNDDNLPIGDGECPTRYRVDYDVNGSTGTLYLPLH